MSRATAATRHPLLLLHAIGRAKPPYAAVERGYATPHLPEKAPHAMATICTSLKGHPTRGPGLVVAHVRRLAQPGRR